MQSIEKFSAIYGRDVEGVAFCPYRVCPIGAHSDHNLGKITGLATNKGIHIAYASKHNGVVEMSSLQFPKRAQWHIDSIPEQKQNDWADYLRCDPLPGISERLSWETSRMVLLCRYFSSDAQELKTSKSSR